MLHARGLRRAAPNAAGGVRDPQGLAGAPLFAALSGCSTKTLVSGGP